MTNITVHASKTYPIFVGHGLLEQAGSLIRQTTGCQRAAILTDEHVAPLYLAPLENALRNAGFSFVCSKIVPAGEESKSLATAGQVYRFLAEHQITRSDVILALGGGVVGDLTGFTASTFLRGIRFVQIPTTLLAQVDSSVGGKTAVNLPEGKNLVGTFCQPSLVLCDLDTLSTLSPELFSDGMAEVLKYGLILDKELYRLLLQEDAKNHLEQIVSRCIDLKRQVVEQDEFDTGLRMLLNFGHTLGHALEKRSGYTLAHGKGVAIGMMLITAASQKAGITPKGTMEEIRRGCEKYGLPTSTTEKMEDLAQVCLGDKKRAGNQIRVIVLKEIGAAVALPLSLEEFQQFVCGEETK